MDIFAKRLKWLREKKGKTQKEVAEYMGVSQQYYGRFEKGQAQPNLEGLVKLSELLGETLEFLLGMDRFDNYASDLFFFYRLRKNKLKRRQERLHEFFDFMKKEDITDEELKNRIRNLMLSNKDAELEKASFERSEKAFLSYFCTIPGNEEGIDEAFLDGMEEDYSDHSRLRLERMKKDVDGVLADEDSDQN